MAAVSIRLPLAPSAKWFVHVPIPELLSRALENFHNPYDSFQLAWRNMEEGDEGWRVALGRTLYGLELGVAEVLIAGSLIDLIKCVCCDAFFFLLINFL